MMSMPDRGGIDEGLQQLETGFDATAHPQRCSGAVPGSGVDPQRLVADRHQPGDGFRDHRDSPTNCPTRAGDPHPVVVSRDPIAVWTCPVGSPESVTDGLNADGGVRPAGGRWPVADSGSIAVHFASVTEDSRSIGTHQVADECGSSSSSRILVALRVVG
jgi:hypothetical protein